MGRPGTQAKVVSHNPRATLTKRLLQISYKNPNVFPRHKFLTAEQQRALDNLRRKHESGEKITSFDVDMANTLLSEIALRERTAKQKP